MKKAAILLLIIASLALLLASCGSTQNCPAYTDSGKISLQDQA
ncbi:MAG: hypothetical protein ACP5DZ_08250 [Bacteroidales bacterium]